MKTTALFLVVLVSVSRCSSSLFENQKQSQFAGLKQIQEIENSKFGRQLLDTIALQMQNQTPLQDIAKLLGDIRADLMQQQRADDTLQAQREEDCELTIADFELRIATAQDNIATAIGTISQLRTEITNLGQQIENYQTQLETLHARRAQVESDRASDRAAFESRTTKSTETVAALDLIIPKLASLTPHAAAQALVELAKIGKSNPIASFMEVASTLDPVLLANVVEKMKQLKESLVASIAEDAANEEAAEAAHVLLLSDIDATVADVEEALAGAQSNLQQAESKLASTETFLAEQQQVLESAKAGLAAKRVECETWRVNYNQTKADRKAEREVVELVQSILAERLQSMSEYLKDRVDN